MQLLKLTLARPEENVALDEALLSAAEAGEGGECLRLWESPTPMVVVGRASRVREEVDMDECARLGIQVLRRSSGGAAIVAGPGCLMYAVVLSRLKRPELATVDGVHGSVLGRIVDAVAPLADGVAIHGISDLAIAEAGGADSAPKKFSGNSLRVVRDWVLYHGTLLYDFDLPLVSQLLKTPPRQPAYRGARSHGSFVANLPIERQALVAAIELAWQVDERSDDYPTARVRELVAERYSQDAWNFAR